MKEASSPQSKSHGGTNRSDSGASTRHRVSAHDHAYGHQDHHHDHPHAHDDYTPDAVPNGTAHHHANGHANGNGKAAAPADYAPPDDPDSSSTRRQPLNTPQAAQPGAVVASAGEKDQKQDVGQTNQEVVVGEASSPPTTPPAAKPSVWTRFWLAFKAVLLNSRLNVLLVFVPVGIAVAQLDGVSPGLVFAMNAVAIVPLAGLLSFATESVAHRLGDSLGALLNVTFGNAVELIIL